VEQEAELIGRWRLERWSGRDGGGAPIRHGGDRPRGELIYLPDRRMAVQIAHDGRPAFGSRALEAGGQGERAAAFATYIAYCGRYSLPEPGVVVHHVELALHPDQGGMEKRRRYELAGDGLTLETQEVLHAGRSASSILRWRRVQRL
jgi:hypothetical protein